MATITERRARACPHGPDEQCTCNGCASCTGHERGCTCDIDWDELTEIRLDQAGRH